MVTFLDHEKSKTCLLVPGVEHTDLCTQLLNEEESRQYLARYFPVPRSAEEEFLRTVNSKDKNNAMFIVAAKPEKNPIGVMGLHNIDWKNRNAVTGSMLLAAQCGKGMGSDAKMLLLSWAFLELGLVKVESRVIAFNERSQAYSRKCGYQEVGRLKRHIFRRGAWHDEVIMEVHVDEWLPLWNQFQEGSFGKKSAAQ